MEAHRRSRELLEAFERGEIVVLVFIREETRLLIKRLATAAVLLAVVGSMWTAC